MIPRARLALMCVYVLLTVAGLTSFIEPVGTVKLVLVTPLMIGIYSAFFTLGGLTAFTGLAMRYFRPAQLGWWFIEIAGLCLLSTATLVYASVLIDVAIETRNRPVVGVAAIVTALATSMAARAWEALQMRRMERDTLHQLEARQDGGRVR